MVEQFDSWAQTVGPYGFLVFALAAFLEYVVPPFPGDTVTLLGGIYAVRGERSPVLLFLAVTTGSVLGSAVDYGVGRLIAGRIERHPEGRLFFGLSHQRIRRAQEAMRRKGTVMLLVNRFLPTMRAMIFVAAGASRMPIRRVLLLGAVSAAGWNLLIMGAGLAVGGNAQRLEALWHSYQQVMLAALALALVGYLLYRLRRRPRVVPEVGP